MTTTIEIPFKSKKDIAKILSTFAVVFCSTTAKGKIIITKIDKDMLDLLYKEMKKNKIKYKGGEENDENSRNKKSQR